MQKVRWQSKSPINDRNQLSSPGDTLAYEAIQVGLYYCYLCTRDIDRSDVPASHRAVLPFFAFVANVCTVAIEEIPQVAGSALFAAFSLACLTGHAWAGASSGSSS